MIRSSQRLLVAGLLLLGSLLPLQPLLAQYGPGPQYNGEGFGKNKIQYRDFSGWTIYHSPHFNVYFYPAEEHLLQKVVSFAESAYDQLSREFNFQIQEPIPLIYYATHSAFEQNNIIMNFIPEGTGAFATPTRFRMVMPVDVPDPDLMKLILHELTHIFQYHLLFQGSLAKAVASTPPQWFMEGMASYMAKDEQAREFMYLRDAVVNDQIPSITRGDPQGFFAYRLGHAAFDFIEERWGKEGFLDFIYEIRNTLGFQVDRAVQRTFKMDPDDFDAEFRRWLRHKYLPELVQTGEPGDFGRIFHVREGSSGTETSPTASPSGDLVAAFSYSQGDLDVVLFDAQKRIFLRNLTRGYTNRYQYLVSQELSLGRGMGRDLSFSPDGNSIAVFAKREKGRSLVLLDVLNGGIRRIYENMGGIEQQLAPAFSPDGKKVAFFGAKEGKFDIFMIDLDTEQITNLTNDDIYDGAPTFSPDGKSIVFVSVAGAQGHAKLFRMDLDHPGQRFQLTGGDSNENDPIYSPDGQRIYLTSDRAGLQNVYSLDLATGDVRQYTNVVTGAFMPTVLHDPQGEDRLVYTGFWKGDFGLYVANVDEPLGEPVKTEIPGQPQTGQIPTFEPDIQVTLDKANESKYGGYKFFLEDAGATVAVDSNQNYLGQVVLTFSNNLGDKRIIGQFASIESFSNFDVVYADLGHRLQWQAHVFDQRDYYIAQDFVSGRIERGRAATKVTGAVGSIVYPFTFYHRAELGVGYVFRDFLAQTFVDVPGVGPVPAVQQVKDDFPLVQGALVGDSGRYGSWGAVAGRRWRLDTFYAPDLDLGGSRVFMTDIDARQYLPVTRRSNLAFRGFYGYSTGNQPNPYYFGGLDTLRGTEFGELSGDRAFFANMEYRFPLIDLLATPVIAFQGVRGVFFFDVGGAWYSDFQDFKFWNSDENKLQDAIAAYGWGMTIRLFGLDLNWDFARRTDLKDQEKGFRTSFWIGTRF